MADKSSTLSCSNGNYAVQCASTLDCVKCLTTAQALFPTQHEKFCMIWAKLCITYNLSLTEVVSQLWFLKSWEELIEAVIRTWN